MNKILLLEDDVILSKEINEFLTNNQFECDAVFDGSLVLKQCKLKNYDMAILDINVPGLNGIEVCKQLRATNDQILILMLTAFGEVEDKVTAFNNGADDYLVKPFHFDELLVRVISLLRRKAVPQSPKDVIKIADLLIDNDEVKVTRNGVEINLSPKEFKLINILAKANGRVLSKKQIADQLWDYHIETNQNTIEVYINFLRKKIDKEFTKKLINTKVGYGYYLKDEEA
ncbi:MAG: response regulator transcription factor [Bacteroidetes bacterium]|nr:response regulator transcription factor [Bacteroidota bacterium]